MPESLSDHQRTAAARSRSRAWIYYAVLAVLSVIAAVAQPVSLLGVVLFGAYSYYLYNGGRFVVWFW